MIVGNLSIDYDTTKHLNINCERYLLEEQISFNKENTHEILNFF